jgi:hypothetical protein
MRKLYKVIGNVTTAKGLMVRAYRDAKVEGTLVLEADAESFNDPVGKKFMVSGELIQVVDRKGKDVTKKLGDNLALKPVPYVMKSFQVKLNVDEKLAEGVITGAMSPDFLKLSNVKLQASGKGAAKFAVRDVVLTGSGALFHQEGSVSE